MSVGFFGKMPGHGDFVERGLPAAFKDVWDEWLQHGIAASRASLGDAWLDAYLTSPIWRFALAPGLCGETGWIGLMLPSVDRVGRYFPLTIAASTESESVPLQMLVAAASWHDAVQEAALGALQDDTVDADALEAGIRARSESLLGQPSIFCQKSARDPRESLHAHALWLPFSYGSTPGHGLLAFSHRLLETVFGVTHSVWWTHGSDRVQPAMFVCPRLPGSEAFAGLLADSHQAPGWIQLSGYQLDSASEDLADQNMAVSGSPDPDSTAISAAAAPTTNTADVPREEGALTKDPAPSQFGDLIEDAAPSGSQINEAPVTAVPDTALQDDSPEDVTLVVDPSPSSFGDGPEPVPVSSEEILAGIGEPVTDGQETDDALADDSLKPAQSNDP